MNEIQNKLVRELYQCLQRDLDTRILILEFAGVQSSHVLNHDLCEFMHIVKEIGVQALKKLLLNI